MAAGLRLERYCDDVDRALAFYTEVLGFAALPTEYETYRPLERGGNRLALQTIEELPADHPLVRGGRGAVRGQGVEIVLEVDDLDALHARAVEAGVEVTPLTDQRWGLRDFRLVDPEGYYLRVTTPPAAEARA